MGKEGRVWVIGMELFICFFLFSMLGSLGFGWFRFEEGRVLVDFFLVCIYIRID